VALVACRHTGLRRGHRRGRANAPSASNVTWALRCHRRWCSDTIRCSRWWHVRAADRCSGRRAQPLAFRRRA